MKKRLTLLAVICVLSIFSPSVFAQPTDIGQFCFRAETSTGSTYEYTVQVTDMGNSHFALNGHVWPVAPEGVIYLNPSFEPFNGTAELRGDKVYMTINKSSIWVSPLILGDSVLRADTVYVEMPAATLSNGTFRTIRQAHNITADTDATEYITGTFGLCSE